MMDPRHELGKRYPNSVFACLIIAVVILLCGGLFFSIPSYNEVFHGIKWSQRENKSYENVTVSFAGERYDNGEFEGDIVISSDGDTTYAWENVKIVMLPEKEREYYICPMDANIDTDNDGQIEWLSCVFGCYAMMYADKDWNQISIAVASFDDDGSMLGITHNNVITVPAETLKDAMTITENLSKDTHLEFKIGSRLDSEP